MLESPETATRPNETGFVSGWDEEESLRAEIHHRLMNTFTILSFILEQEYNAPGPLDRGALGRTIHVVHAHAHLHRLLAHADRGRVVDAADHMTSLCRALTGAVLAPLGLRCETTAEAGRLSGAQGEWLGLVICELVLNAAKHAFAGDESGVVHVELVRACGGWRCIVMDNGRGATDRGAPGLGTQIVDALVSRLNGAIAAQSGPSGHSVVIEFPLAIADGGLEA